jgi:hypothetical protein
MQSGEGGTAALALSRSGLIESENARRQIQ